MCEHGEVGADAGAQRGLIALDLETTGLDPAVDRVVSVGAVHEESSFYRLVNPEGRASHPRAQRLHGLSEAALRDARPWRGAGGVGEELEAWLRGTGATVLVGHNLLRFDLRFLVREWGEERCVWRDGRLALPDLELEVEDTLVWCRRLLPKHTSKTQTNVYKVLFGQDAPVVHNALGDAHMCMRIALRLGVGASKTAVYI